MSTDHPEDLLRLLKAARKQGGWSRVRDALAECLAELRPMDQRAARMVLDSQLQLPALLESSPPERLLEFAAGLAGSRSCLGCGTCCRTSSPTLYLEDLALVGEAGIPLSSLYTLRAGELAWSPRNRRLESLASELIKVAEDQSRACVFLAESRCGIYEKRPLQCRHLQCWDQSHAGQLQHKPRLTRAEIFNRDQTGLALIREYEQKLPARQISLALRQAAQGGPDLSALQYLELDHRLRWGIGRRYGYDPAILPLLLGRPIKDWLGSFGLELALDQNQNPRLNRK